MFHYTPTSCSWLNAVGGFFAKLSKRRLKRGAFRSIVDLQAAINRFLRETNDDPKPFIWTADPGRIIAAVKRGHQVLDSLHYAPESGPIMLTLSFVVHDPGCVKPRKLEAARTIFLREIDIERVYEFARP